MRMSFFAKIKAGKKKNKPEIPPQTSNEEGADPLEVPDVVSHQVHSPTSPSPTNYAVQASSIFTGLHLSSKVAHSEAPDSPYMKRNITGKLIF